MQDLMRPGDRLTRKLINDIPRHTLRMIRPGPGIRIVPTGDGVMISATQTNRPRILPTSNDLRRVLVLPPLPQLADGEVRVFWLDATQGLAELGSAGTGDNQVWTCVYPQDRYYPQDKYTTLSGVPV